MTEVEFRSASKSFGGAVLNDVSLAIRDGELSEVRQHCRNLRVESDPGCVKGASRVWIASRFAGAIDEAVH